MKETISKNRKYQKELCDMRYKLKMALSKFTSNIVGQPDYKTSDGRINYYPSDILYDWRYKAVDINRQIIDDPTVKPSEVAGIICEGAWHMRDTPREMTIMFNDL